MRVRDFSPSPKDWGSGGVQLDVRGFSSLVTRWRLLLSPPVRFCKPTFQIALRGHRSQVLLPTLRYPVADHVARDSLYLNTVQRMAKVCYTIPICTFTLRKDNPMNGTFKQSIRPEMHQIPNVHKDRWKKVVLCARWIYTYRRPRRTWGKDLQAWLGGALEKESERT